MGTHYKAALIPERVRETINVSGMTTRRRRRRKRRHGGMFSGYSKKRTYDEDEDEDSVDNEEVELQAQPIREITLVNEGSSRATPLHRHSASISLDLTIETIPRSSSLPK
ncbi:Mlo14p [Stylosanthes scabra]|uniref:Mlo14p n=1 Tax=Stylosanthes scabra TaxID=79078 RepID=A0ABU6VQP0_9FABA|nr:Mlo14p [Stylosanthes scabra]